MSSNPYVTKVELGVELDKQNQKIDLKVNNLELGVNGSIDTTTNTTSLPDGVYRTQIPGTYTNAGNIVVKEGYYTLLRKVGGVWKLESEVKMPMQDLTNINNDIIKLKSEDNLLYQNIESEIYGGVASRYLPSRNFILNSYTLNTGSVSTIYVDNRNKLNTSTDTLTKVNVFVQKAGDIVINFLKTDNSIIKTITKNAVVGLNTFNITSTDLSGISGVYLIGVCPISSSLHLISNNNNTTAYKLDNTIVTYVKYDFSYSIDYHINVNGMNGKVNETHLEVFDKTNNVVLPLENYVDSTFTANTGNINNIYFDTRNFISYNKKITVKVKCATDGNINIVAIKSDATVLKSINKAVVLGINSIELDFSDVAESFYIGIQPLQSGLGVKSNANATTARVKRNGSSTIGSLAYDLGYEVSYKEGNSVLDRLDKIEVEIFIPKSFDIVKELNLKNRVYLPDYPIDLETELNIPSGKEIIGVKGKSIINVKDTARYGFNIGTSNDVYIKNVTLKGSAPNTPINTTLNPVMAGIVDSFQEAKDLNKIGLINGVIKPQTGIRLNGGEKVVIEGCEIMNFSEFGFHVSKTGKKYQYALNFLNNSLHDNYCGIKTDLEAERSFYTDNYVTLNQIGFYMDSGTNDIKGMSLNANRIGMVLSNGFNHAHGLISNIQITHNSLLDLIAYQVEFGQNFDNSKFGFNASSQNIYLYQSKGIIFNFCQLVSFGSIVTDGIFPNDTTNSRNAFINCTSNTGSFTFGEINGGIAPYKKGLFTPNPASTFNTPY